MGFRTDRRFASCLRGGDRVNFRLVGGVRGQVAGLLPGAGTGKRRVREGVCTPSLHPEVPDTQFVSPGHGLGIRQPMGRTKVCQTAQSGIWVLKGVARARMLPDNLGHLRVEWRKQRVHTRPPGRIPLVTLVCKRECANGSEPEPVRQSKIVHPSA